MATVFPELYETTRQRAFDAFVAGAVVGGLVMVLVFGGMLWFTRYPDFAGPFPFVVLLHWPLTAVMFFVGLAIFGVPC